MSRMSGVLILSNRLKEVTNSYVLYWFEHHRIIHISSTKCLIQMGFGLKCSNSNGKVIYTEKSKLNIADMWLILLDCVTNIPATKSIQQKGWSFSFPNIVKRTQFLWVCQIWGNFMKNWNFLSIIAYSNLNLKILLHMCDIYKSD